MVSTEKFREAIVAVVALKDVPRFVLPLPAHFGWPYLCFFLCSDSRAELCMLHVIYFYLFLIASAFFRFSAHNFMHCTGFLRFPNKLRALICIQNSMNKNEN